MDIEINVVYLSTTDFLLERTEVACHDVFREDDEKAYVNGNDIE